MEMNEGHSGRSRERRTHRSKPNLQKEMTRPRIIWDHLPSEEVHTCWEVRTSEIISRLRHRHRTEVAGESVTWWQRLTKTWPSCLFTFLCVHVDIIKRCTVEWHFPFQFLLILWLAYACVRNKRPLSAQDVVRRHQQMSYITTSSESEF